jgi:hypothetical protein
LCRLAGLDQARRLMARSMASLLLMGGAEGRKVRALYELMNLDVYELLDLDVDGYDTATCPPALIAELRRPLRRVLG